ncbi:hypothetical protein HNQ94_000786 [Salirhabdus euzebyi]|uniref:DUF4190 domain-containing protein n=1 Tax=Salirhabdus euzebyi TaxID=394506 RepID=A0A841PYW8_9BACI|nr:DUF4190 domain-containing protein [Salirhabdus euzebyi]MBB6452341.1 hypothetical protein [Salirhabdus euzebyi]
MGNHNQVMENGRQNQSKGLAISALVLGIIGLVFYWVPLIPYPIAILAIVFGAIGMNQSKGMAITGFILGLATLALKAWFWLGLVAYFS